MIAVKRNNYSTCLMLLDKGADPNFKNDIGLTAFDYSILYCNYEISLYFKNKFNCLAKEIDYYLEQGNKIKAPLFNVKSFLDCLNSNTPIEQVPQFRLTSQQNKGIF